MDEIERRHGYKDVSNRLSHLETEIAVIQERVADTHAIKRWLFSQLAAIVIASIAIAVAWGELHQQVSQISLTEFRQDISTALLVLGQHGDELQAIRGEEQRIRAVMDDMQARFHARLESQTDDRFRRRDFDAIFNPQMRLIDMQIKRNSEEISRLVRYVEHKHRQPITAND